MVNLYKTIGIYIYIYKTIITTSADIQWNLIHHLLHVLFVAKKKWCRSCSPESQIRKKRYGVAQVAQDSHNPFIPLLCRALYPAGRPATGVPVPPIGGRHCVQCHMADLVDRNLFSPSTGLDPCTPFRLECWMCTPLS